MIDDRMYFWMASILFTGACIYAVFCLVRRRHYPRAIMLSLVGAGFVLQTLGLYQRGLDTRSCPLGNLFEIIQFITWSAILLYLIVGPAFRMSMLGLFSAGFAAFLSLVALVMKPWDAPYSEATVLDPWIETHASLAIFSYGVLGLLAVTAGMYLLQSYGLKHKQFRGFFPFLPAVIELDAMNRRLLFSGTSVLSLAIALGFIMGHVNPEAVAPLKLGVTVAVWLAYLTVLVMRTFNKIVPQRFAWACLLIYAAALLSLWAVESGRLPSPNAAPVSPPEAPAPVQIPG